MDKIVKTKSAKKDALEALSKKVKTEFAEKKALKALDEKITKLSKDTEALAKLTKILDKDLADRKTKAAKAEAEKKKKGSIIPKALN